VTLVAFEYCLIRAVPRVDRGEFVNVAAVLYCQARDFLGCGGELAPERLRAIDPEADLDAVKAALDGICAVCEGRASAGAVAAGPLRARFGWLTAARSTVVQAGPVHSGLTADPAVELEKLVRRLVR
jgi:Protein of unknown function (DUF3037)